MCECEYAVSLTLLTAMCILSGVVKVASRMCDERGTASGKLPPTYLLCCNGHINLINSYVLLTVHIWDVLFTLGVNPDLPLARIFSGSVSAGRGVDVQATCYPNGTLSYNWTSDSSMYRLQIEYQCFYNGTFHQQTVSALIIIWSKVTMNQRILSVVGITDFPDCFCACNFHPDNLIAPSIIEKNLYNAQLCS